MTKHFVFDLDGTLIDTSNLKPYMGTNEGRRYVESHLNDLETTICQEGLVDLINFYHKKERVSIVTNSPRDYALGLLQKHGFPTVIHLVYGANKPNSSAFEVLSSSFNIPKEDMVSIGDSATDILAAHDLEIPSIAVSWGGVSSKKQLKKSEPRIIVSDVGGLEKSMAKFSGNKLKYSPRKSPEGYVFLPEQYFDSNVPAVDFNSLGDYIGWNSYNVESFRNSLAPFILTFKNAKNFSIRELKEGKTDDFFSGGRLKTGAQFLEIIVNFIEDITEQVTNFNLDGKTCFLAVPNSFPDYCYKTLVNQIVVFNVVDRLDKNSGIYMPKHNLIYRVHPTIEAHTSSDRSMKKHYETIGMKDFEDYLDADNILLFDDVMTSGNQLSSVAKIMEHFGFKGNFISLTLGRTVGAEPFILM